MWLKQLEMEIARVIHKKPCETGDSPGSKNQFRRHIPQTWVLFGKTPWCLTSPKTNQKGVV